MIKIVIRKMQIQTITPVHMRMAKVQKTDNTNCAEFWDLSFIGDVSAK